MPSAQLGFSSRGSFFFSPVTLTRSASVPLPSCLSFTQALSPRYHSDPKVLVMQVSSPLLLVFFLGLELGKQSADKVNHPTCLGQASLVMLSRVPRRERFGVCEKQVLGGRGAWLGPSCLLGPRLVQKSHFLDSQPWNNEIMDLK